MITQATRIFHNTATNVDGFNVIISSKIKEYCNFDERTKRAYGKRIKI